MEHVEDEDTVEYVTTEEYEEDTEDYVKEYTRMDYEKQKVVNLASGRYVPVIPKLGGGARGMKRPTSEIYNQDIDVGGVPRAHVNQKRYKQGCTSAEDYTLMGTEKQKVASLASGRHEPVILECGVDARGLKRSSSDIYVIEGVDVGCDPPARHVDQKRSNLPQQHTFPSDWPEGESLSVPISPSSRANCRPCIRE